MPNHKATKVIEIAGGFKKNPNRRRVDPPSVGKITPPPAHLNEYEQGIWNELIAASPDGVLQASDAAALEIVVTLMADYRRDRASFIPAKLGLLQKGLSTLGFTPVDRSKLAVPAPTRQSDDPWARLAADG